VGSVFARLGQVAASLALLAVMFFFAVFVVRPRIVLRRFDAFVARHPAGSSIAALIEDPFVDAATLAGFSGKRPEVEFSVDRAASLARLRAEVKSVPRGALELMWTHTPPFGRVFVDVEFSDGKVTAVRASSLD